jgi:predicted TIM-barrel fold metal-dependent hydrolase
MELPSKSGREIDRPVFLRRLSTDEYDPAPYSSRDQQVVARTGTRLAVEADERRRPLPVLAAGPAGTAAGLAAINAEWGQTFYEVPEEALRDDATASAAFAGPELVIDVQTHFMAPHSQNSVQRDGLRELYRGVMPEWWTEIDASVKWDLAAYIKNVFLETETAVAVLTSGPGLDDSRHLFNDEMAATRSLIDGFAGSGRLLSHSVVHANVERDVEAMEEYRDLFHPVGWKVYTLGGLSPEGPVHGWRLDDDDGLQFVERARELDVKLICAHKGLSFLVDNGSPSDVGPVARQFPDVTFIVYHSGYEMPTYGAASEGPYTDATAGDGVNRLIATLRDNGIPRGANVYAELGTTWFSLIRRPVEAAHVLGKLIAELGEDHVIWGTDSIWYGATQPLIDALRVFQIPDSMCDEFGYRKLTPEVKEKILSLNAARVYGIDITRMRQQVEQDDVAWARQLIREYEEKGFTWLR